MAVNYQSFDDVYTVFMNTTKVDEFQLPNTPDGMYSLLEYGLEQYMLFYDDAQEVSFDRDTEQLSVNLTRKDVNLIVSYMRLKIFQKLNDEFVSTYDVLVDDIGIKNYKSQSDAKRSLISEQEKEIKRMLLKMSEDFDVLDDIL